MFSADEILVDIKVEDILKSVSEYDIFKKYCKQFEEINKSFCSEFYNDTRPSCRIRQSNKDKLYYIDYGSGDYLGCFDYVMKKYSCSLHEVLNIIANDFGLLKLNISKGKELLLGEPNNFTPKERVKSTITIQPREWSLVDEEYWTKRYSIPFDLLDKYNVIPCQHAYLHKGDKTITFTHSDENPIYAYKFEGENAFTYKIYFPLAKSRGRKWLFSGTSVTDIGGYKQLDKTGDILILTKSLKDCICYRLLGYNAISLQGEANKLEENLTKQLLRRFEEIIINYDNDDQGLKSARRIVDEYKFRYFTIPLKSGCKDLSEYIDKYGFSTAADLIDTIMNGRETRRGMV